MHKSFARGYALFTVSLLILLGCATSGAVGGTVPQGGARSSKVLTLAEMMEVQHLSALEAVQQLRPTWLRTRGAVSMESSSQQGVRLLVDRNPMGLAEESLGQFLVSDVEEIQFLSGREATTRFGTGYPDGVLVLTTRR